MQPQEKLKSIRKEIWSHYDREIYGFSEFDQDINQLTRQMISTFQEMHGNIWLGNINLYDETRSNPVLVRYTGELVRNFEYKFMVPVYDEKLIDMIRDRDRAEYTGTADDKKRIDEIFNRIEELKGIYLVWV